MSVVGTLLKLAPAFYGTMEGLQRNAEIAGIARQNARRGALQQEASMKAIRDIDFSPSQAVADAAQNRIGFGERVNVNAARRGDDVNARTIAALGENERLLRAVGPRAYEAGLEHALEGELKGVDIKTQADMFLSEAEQRGLDQGRQRDLALDQMMLEQGINAYNAGIQGDLAATAAEGEALASGGVAVTEALLSMTGGQKSAPGDDDTDDDTGNDTGDDTGDDTNDDMERLLSKGETQYMGFPGGLPVVKDTRSDFDPIEMYGPFIPDDAPIYGTQAEQQAELEAAQMINPLTQLPYEFDDAFSSEHYDREQGGYIAEGGGVTEGEFSHDTNKKAVIDEESGEKEGELTGGEVVFNPEQTDKIEDFIEDRDADGLLQYMSMLFSLPQFQEA